MYNTGPLRGSRLIHGNHIQILVVVEVLIGEAYRKNLC